MDDELMELDSAVLAHRQTREDRLALIEWGNRGYFHSQCGNREEAMRAWEMVGTYAQRVIADSELKEDLLVGLQHYSDMIQAQLEMTTAERDELEATLQTEALSIAAEMVRLERERLLQDDNALEEAMIQNMEDRMVLDGHPDSVREEEERATDYRIRQAWQRAQDRMRGHRRV